MANISTPGSWKIQTGFNWMICLFRILHLVFSISYPGGWVARNTTRATILPVNNVNISDSETIDLANLS